MFCLSCYTYPYMVLDVNKRWELVNPKGLCCPIHLVHVHQEDSLMLLQVYQLQAAEPIAPPCYEGHHCCVYGSENGLKLGAKFLQGQYFVDAVDNRVEKKIF